MYLCFSLNLKHLKKLFPLLSKKLAYINLATRWLSTSIIQNTNVIVGLTLSTTGTNVTTVFCVHRKKIKSDLKLLLMETEVATHPCKLPQEKQLNIGGSIWLSCNIL